MEIGAFSVSLAVKDIEASWAFYARLGFEPAGGDVAQGWLILRSGQAVIGLFQGMFEKNMLTFNPGWDGMARPVAEFEDVRDIEARLRAAGVEIATAAAEGDGPASFVVIDPDGNPVLVDQHVARPGRE